MIKTTISQHGFEGILFPVKEQTEKVMIVISGSNGGMKMTKSCSEFYYKNGISALAVALFHTKGTQKNLDKVPVEYIESAITYLRNRGYKRIGIDGISKGSELALLAASMFSDLSCVIARVPSHFISEGLVFKGKSKIPSGTSCWSYRGKEFPYAKYNVRSFDIKGTLIKEKEFSYPYKHIVYKNMSHMMVTEIGILYKLAFKSERNNLKACAEERKNLAMELLNWVRVIWY